MKDKDLIRIKHMLDSVQAILSFVRGRKRSDLDAERLLVSGIVREFEILGEAAGRVSVATRKAFPNLPWKQLIGMRNRLIHAYFDVDHDILWKTVKKSLPELSRQLKELIGALEE
jgi:uncharacterized protein with HEPN domain